MKTHRSHTSSSKEVTQVLLLMAKESSKLIIILGHTADSQPTVMMLLKCQGYDWACVVKTNALVTRRDHLQG